MPRFYVLILTNKPRIGAVRGCVARLPLFVILNWEHPKKLTRPGAHQWRIVGHPKTAQSRFPVGIENLKQNIRQKLLLTHHEHMFDSQTTLFIELHILLCDQLPG